METEGKMRQYFEKWCSEDGKWNAAIHRDLNGNYLLQQTASDWGAWQAAWKSCEEYHVFKK